MLAASAALLAVMTGVTAYALTQRSEAQKQAALALTQQTRAEQLAGIAQRAEARGGQVGRAGTGGGATGTRGGAETRRNRPRSRNSRKPKPPNRLRTPKHHGRKPSSRSRKRRRHSKRRKSRRTSLQLSQADAEQQAANAQQQQAEAQKQKEIAQKAESAAKQQAAIAKRARARAVAEARIAEGRAFAATALTELSTDPELAVRDALQAARLDPESAEDVLRKSLAASRVRSVLPSGGGDAQDASSRANGARMLTAGSGGGDAQDASFSREWRAHVDGGKRWRGAHLQRKDGLVGPSLKVGSFIRAASFSPDGRLVATASRDGFARLWSVESGDVLYTLRHGSTRRHEPCLLSGTGNSWPPRAPTRLRVCGTSRAGDGSGT